MKFSTREDIEAPVDYVFDNVSDFAGFERRALRRGAKVARLNGDGKSAGAEWDIVFKFRGRERQMWATLSRFDAPNGYDITTQSDGMTIFTQVELVPLSRGRTRLAVSMDLRAKTLTARLLLQSMKLAKGKLVKRFKATVLEYGEDVADEYRKRG